MSQILRHKTKPKCGTRSGYDYHRRVLYQEPCFKCEKAERTYHRERRAANREKVNAMRKINRINNPAITIRTRYTKEQITELYGTDCYLCLRPIDFEAPSKVGLEGWELSYHPDHVIPLSKGGLDVIENLRPTHGQCNIRKAATVLKENR